MHAAAVVALFVATLGALYVRPFGLRDWQIAAIGGTAAWVASPLSPAAGADVLRDSWNIFAFFLGLMLIAAGADCSGLYARAAGLLGRASGRAGVALVLIVGAAITAVLSNDATPLVLTPAVFAVARRAGASATAPAFAVTFVADGASLLLPMSNPVNILFYDRFDMTFAEYAREILPAAAAGAAVLGAAVLWRSGGGSGERPAPALTVRSEGPPPVGLQRAAIALVALLAIAYFAAAIAEFPLGVVSLAGGSAFLALVAAFRGDLARYRGKVAPGVLVFVAGLLLLVEALSETGLLDGLGSLYGELAGQPALLTILGAAITATVLSNVMNNWPAALVLSAVIANASAGAQGELIAGTLIGCTIGANLTVVGSLSTVFWIALARAEGATFTPGAYVRRAALPTTAALAAACVVAAAVQAW